MSILRKTSDLRPVRHLDRDGIERLLPGEAVRSMLELTGVSAFRRRRARDEFPLMYDTREYPGLYGRTGCRRLSWATMLAKDHPVASNVALGSIEALMPFARLISSNTMAAAVLETPPAWMPSTEEEWFAMNRCAVAAWYPAVATGTFATLLSPAKGRWSDLMHAIAEKSDMPFTKIGYLGPQLESCLGTVFSRTLLPALFHAGLATEKQVIRARRAMTEEDWVGWKNPTIRMLCAGMTVTEIAALLPLSGILAIKRGGLRVGPDSRWEPSLPDLLAPNGVLLKGVNSRFDVLGPLGGNPNAPVSKVAEDWCKEAMRGEMHLMHVSDPDGRHRVFVAGVRNPDADDGTVLVHAPFDRDDERPGERVIEALDWMNGLLRDGILRFARQPEARAPMPDSQETVSEDWRDPKAFRRGYDMDAPLIPMRLRKLGNLLADPNMRGMLPPNYEPNGLAGRRGAL